MRLVTRSGAFIGLAMGQASRQAVWVGAVASTFSVREPCIHHQATSNLCTSHIPPAEADAVGCILRSLSCVRYCTLIYYGSLARQLAALNRPLPYAQLDAAFREAPLWPSSSKSRIWSKQASKSDAGSKLETTWCLALRLKAEAVNIEGYGNP